MIVKRVTAAGRAPRGGELFVGTHEYQRIFGGDESGQFHLSEMSFRDGNRTRLHVHTSDQIIIVTSGEGIVASADTERRIAVGDVALLAAGEPHWHGASALGTVTFWSVLGPHQTRLAQVE